MKTQLYTFAFALIASASVLVAQESTTTKTTVTNPDGSSETTVKTTTSTGTLTEYVPGTTFIMKEDGGPVTYVYGKKVAYVTKSGKVITQDMLDSRVRVGNPVSVRYITDGNNRVISTVVVDD